MKLRLWFLACAILASEMDCALAQVITTIAGTDFPFPATPLAGTDAPAGTLAAVAVDAAGNVYVVDNSLGNDLVYKVTPQGTLTVAAGNGIFAFAGDGAQATSAALDSPGGVAVDPAGNLYIVDSFSQTIRKVTPQGIITRIAGNGGAGYSGDGGPATAATFNFAGFGGIVADFSGNVYIADEGNNVIRKVTPGGTISTVAGNGTAGFSGDGGSAIKAALNFNAGAYMGLAVDAAGNLFIPDMRNNRIRMVTPGGIISTVAGNGLAGYSGDGGRATVARLNLPSAVAVDAAGNLFICDTNNIRVRKVTPLGTIITVAGSGFFGFTGDGGQAVSASMSLLSGVAVDSADNLYIVDSINSRIRKVTAAGVISTFIGNGKFRFSGDGGPATAATLNIPEGLALDPTGNVFVADNFNDRIRKVSTTGTISTFAGDGVGDYSGDGGPALQAGLLFPYGVAWDSSGDLFIADTINDVVRKVSSNGFISTFAGSGTHGFSGDGGQATRAALLDPVAVALDASGNVFIADNQNNRVRKVASDGVISTVVGTGAAGFSGDGGPAGKAALNQPTGLTFDASGNLFIADSANERIRKVSPDGIINTVAGNGTLGSSGDGGPALQAELNLETGAFSATLAVDSAGNLFFPDYFNGRVRKVTPGGFISTVAGNGNFGFFGDGGLATNANLAFPSAVALNSAGDLFISDTFNNRIREVLATAPDIAAAPNQLKFTASSNGAPSEAQTLSVTSAVEGLAFSIAVPAGANWLQLNPSSGASPRLIQVIADPTGLPPNTYQTTLTINAPNASPSSMTIAVSFNVTAELPPTLSIDKPSLSFPFPQHGTLRSQTVTVLNTGGGALAFTATPSTASGGKWLSVSPTSAQTFPGSPVTLTITANPAGLGAGTYVGEISIAAGSQSQTVAVTMTVSALSQAILLSQSGMSFLAVQSGGVVPSQSFGVQNTGTGKVNWTTSTSTLSGGSGWLHVTPASGSSDASASIIPRVTVSINTSTLPAGTYYGLVRVNAPGAANSPQVLTIALQVLPSNAKVAGVVQPAQLIFTATQGGEAPGSQIVQVYNIVPGAKSFKSLVSGDDGLFALTLPKDATLDPQQPTSIVVQPLTSLTPAGVYNGALTFQFSDGNVSAVKLTLIVLPAPAHAANSTAKVATDRPEVATGCTPTKLFPVMTTLGQTFTVSAGWPTALVVNVKDDCGTPLPNGGSVTVHFSDGEPPLSLQATGGGSWETTWPTGKASTGVTLKVHAASSQGIAGDAEITGNLDSQQQPPVFDRPGITSGAVVSAFTALAPGSVISIYGSRLAESTANAATLPLPTELVDTQVFVAGTTGGGGSTGLLNLPLYFVSEGQVNAMVPFEVNVNTSLQLLVQRGSTYSLPVQVDMAQAQPAMFSATGLSGGAGLIYVYPANGGPPHLASAGPPAHAGDTIVLFCAGLGAVSPSVPDGAAPGSKLSSIVATPKLIVGGQSAQVLFAGLAPGFAGLYQVNAVLPSGTQTGPNVPAALIVGGQTSPSVTLAIQ